MQKVIIKRSKLIRGKLLDQATGCMCFTGFILRARGFTDEEINGWLTPGQAASHVKDPRKGLAGLVELGSNTRVASDLMTINDFQSGQIREDNLTRKAKEIDVEAIFVD